MLGFMLNWYLERKRDKVIYVQKLADKVYRLTGGQYVKDNIKIFKVNKLPYIIGKSTFFNKHNRKIFLFDIENNETISYDQLGQTGLTKEEFDAYVNGGFISSLRNFMKKSIADYLLIAFAFLGGAGFMAIVNGLI